jgi:hypothetical protein
MILSCMQLVTLCNDSHHVAFCSCASRMLLTCPAGVLHQRLLLCLGSATGILIPAYQCYSHQILHAALHMQGMFYFFYNATGKLFYSSDGGRSFKATRSVLRIPDNEWEQVTIKARPEVQGEVWVGYPWSGGLVRWVSRVNYGVLFGSSSTCKCIDVRTYLRLQGGRGGSNIAD